MQTSQVRQQRIFVNLYSVLVQLDFALPRLWRLPAFKQGPEPVSILVQGGAEEASCIFQRAGFVPNSAGHGRTPCGQ